MPSQDVSLEEVKKNIRALLISAPNGLSVDDIEHDYRAMLGKPLPYKQFKCSTCLDFLKTMPDVVSPTWVNGTLILRGIADASTRHIAKLVSRQKNTSKSRRIFKPAISTKPLVVPSYFRANIKELLSVFPNGVLGSALNSAYARHYGMEINYAKLGFKSMSHLLGSIQDIATIVKNPKGGYRVVGVAKKKSSSQGTRPQDVKPKPPPLMQNSKSSNMPNRNKATDLTSLENDVVQKKETNIEKTKKFLDSKSGVSESLKEDLISVLAKRPNGVWAARLPFEYKTLFNQELSVLSLGFYSVIEMASSMPDIFRIERPFTNGDWLLFLADKSKKDKNITRVHLPEGAIGKGASYVQQSLPESDYIELYVTHIKTPECFWVQLIKHAAQLETLRNNMRAFYGSKESAQYLMDDSLVKLGQVCVARFPVDHAWYRALITATRTQTVVEVFYVDYGNSAEVSKSDLRLMKKEFFQFPSQALKSKLDNIKPKMTAKWDPKAAHRLHELTADKALVGLVSNRKDDVLSLCICDTNSNDDVHINDVLVEEGYAVMKKVSRQRVKPPGLASPDAKQRGINQQISMNTAQPVFPVVSGCLDGLILELRKAGKELACGSCPACLDQAMRARKPSNYSLPLNPFSGVPSYGIIPLVPLPSVGQAVPAPPEEKPPTFEEDKPSEEDLDFMRQVCEELSDKSTAMVKRLDLPENKFIHLINYQGNPFVVRTEISALLWESDLLRSMLRQKKMVVPKEVVAREDNEELFNELKRLKVGDFDNGDEDKQFASLYALSSIPGILETFKHPCAELIQRLKEENVIFEQSPGTYWSEDKDDINGTDDSCPSEPEEEPNLEELKLAEQALQFRRKRIVRSMLKGEIAPGENAVDEVDEVEKQLATIHELIIKAEAREKCKDVEDARGNSTKQEGKGKENRDVKESKDRHLTPVSQPSVEMAKPAQPEAKPVRPVGVTRPEVRCTVATSKKPPEVEPTIPNEEKPKEKLMATKQETAVDKQDHHGNTVGEQGGTVDQQQHYSKTGNKQEYYLDRVECAKKTIEHLAIAKSGVSALPKGKNNSATTVSSWHPTRFSSQVSSRVASSRHSVPSLLAAPTYVPHHNSAGPLPLSNFSFPATNVAPHNLQFPHFMGPLHPMGGSFPDFVTPPNGPYHTPALFGQPPVQLPPIYFPWGSPFSTIPPCGDNVRERPAR